MMGNQRSFYDACMAYKADGVPLIIFAGQEYGTGSSRDWAAKGTSLLGVKAVVAQSFERIHRSNLVGMGVLPLQFPEGVTAQTAGEPPWPRGVAQFLAVPTVPYTARSLDGTITWRMLATRVPGGGLLFYGQRLDDVNGAVNRLVFIELVVGASTLLVLSSVGRRAWSVRSLRPLADMERTATAIAAGDLTRRVPEYEPGRAVPKTEVGHARPRAQRDARARSRARSQARAHSEAAAQDAAAVVPRTRARPTRRSTPRPAPGAPRSGCGSSPRTPRTSCVPR